MAWLGVGQGIESDKVSRHGNIIDFLYRVAVGYGDSSISPLSTTFSTYWELIHWNFE